MPRQPAIPINGTPLKLTMVMKTPTKVLSEVHWWNNTGDFDAANISANGSAMALANQRIAMLPSDCKMLYWNLSQENVYRDSYGNTQQLGTVNNLGEPENIGNDCVGIFMQSTPQYRRHMYLGCIPDTVIINDAFLPGANPAFSAAFNTYMRNLTGQANPGAYSPVAPVSQPWGFLPATRDPGITVKVAITSFVYVPGAPTIVAICAASSLCVAGDVVRISGVANVGPEYPMNQLWQVLSVSVDKTMVTLNNFSPQALQPLNPLVNGSLQKMERDFQYYSGYVPTSPGSRRRGTRTAQPLGRRKRKYNIGYPG